jgi:hypothetical protein
LDTAAAEGEGWWDYLGGLVTKHVKGSDAQQYEAWRKSEALGISKWLNGGRPTDVDTARIEGMLPEWGQPHFKGAATLLKEYIAARLRGNVLALAREGYDTGFMRGAGVDSLFNTDRAIEPAEPQMALFKMPGLKKLGVK